MNNKRKLRYVVFGLFVLMALMPLAVAEGNSSGTFQLLGALTERDRLNIPEQMRELRRLRATVEEECTKRTKADPTTVCPDINDEVAVRRFLRGMSAYPVSGSGSSSRSSMSAESSSSVSSKKSSRMPTIDIFDLTDNQKAMLRRFERVQKCPDDLDAVVPGFFKLCTKTIISSPRAFRGFSNDLIRTVKVKEKKEPTLRDIIDMFKGARPAAR